MASLFRVNVGSTHVSEDAQRRVVLFGTDEARDCVAQRGPAGKLDDTILVVGLSGDRLSSPVVDQRLSSLVVGRRRSWVCRGSVVGRSVLVLARRRFSSVVARRPSSLVPSSSLIAARRRSTSLVVPRCPSSVVACNQSSGVGPGSAADRRRQRLARAAPNCTAAGLGVGLPRDGLAGPPHPPLKAP